MGVSALRKKMVLGGPRGKAWTRYLAAPGDDLAGCGLAERRFRNGECEGATPFQETVDEVGGSVAEVLWGKGFGSVD